MTDRTDRETLACPLCGKDVTLWEAIEVPGWRGIDRNGNTDGQQDVDWTWVEVTGEAGCGECGWEGRRADLEAVTSS